VKKARLKYPHCPPHTREALLYREMFEKLYAGRSEMIPGYWMPNADWPGCKVDDPSARVLSNYGGSGK
jgi:asparagine synthase (glutamine-hydrolysing)